MSLSQYGTAPKRTKSESISNTNGARNSKSTIPHVHVSQELSQPELLDEKTFIRLLRLERKRSERSGRRFILMLLDVRMMLKDKRADPELQVFIDRLSGLIRETDSKGWYKSNLVFGVIFTEIGNGETKSITRVLLDKVTGALWESLTIDEINDVRLSFYVYPEDTLPSEDDGPLDLTLYPDNISDQDLRQGGRAVKRVIDILGSLFALIILSPLLLAIAVAIKLSSRGPILFRQQRIGQYGTKFTFLKFRSMYMANDETIHKDYVTQFISGKQDTDNPAGQRNVFKLKNDPRVTPIGRVLRRSSLDEFPQFLNVLHGEMSLVGPRPPVPYEVACYQTWHKRRLMTVKPGITGLWQVGGRSRVKFDDMVRLDLKYAATWSVWLDLKIILQTPAAILSGEGAY
ncbi:MAG TPA: sugar transferase [Bryobacteraceae bacterium]|nr:sugar transferase [Bryobacteraceae bacterium]